MRSVVRALVLVLFATLTTTTAAIGQPGGDTAARLADRVLGRADAPVLILDYSSLTCSHCADFHTKVLPKVKETYIDTGKARLVFRDFPLDSLAMAAAMLSRCVPTEMYYRFLDALFASQQQWSRAPNPKQALTGLARLIGLSESQVDSCLADKDLFKGIEAMRAEGTSKYAISSTPTFVINGEKLTGAATFEAFEKAIAPHLGRK